MTLDHGGHQQSKLEMLQNISGARATAEDPLGTLSSVMYAVVARKKMISRCLALAPYGRGPICYIFMLCRLEAKIGRRGGDGGAWIMNATINYVLHAWNWFRGCGGGEDGRTACVMAVRLDLRFKIRC